MDILKDITITRLQSQLEDANGAIDSLTINYAKSDIEIERENFRLKTQLAAVRECQTYVVELDDCEQSWFKKADVLKAIGETP